MMYEDNSTTVLPDWAIKATNLRKRFKDKVAIDGFNLHVRTGTVCGLFGPNGAGKTTAIRILTTLLRPDAGEVHIAGCNVLADPRQARYLIGLVGQDTSVDEILTGRQNLTLFAKLYHLPPQAARKRAADLLEQFGLTEAANKPIANYSGGMRRRLDLAASLICSPQVLFLDEPTTGLDPRARNEVWTMITGIASTGTTVLLTTQYLEEADQLANHICLIDAGRVVAEGTPDELKAQVGPDHVETIVSKPTLDEVFLSLTGHHPTTTINTEENPS
jgi:ABC-2 type transport system ATP-binding protein